MILRIVMPKEVIVGSCHEAEFNATRKQLIDGIEKRTTLKYGLDFLISNPNAPGYGSYCQMLWAGNGDNQYFDLDSPILVYFDSTFEEIDTVDKIIDEWLTLNRKEGKKYKPIEIIFVPCRYIKVFK